MQEKEIIEVIKQIRLASKNFKNTALMEVASTPKNAFQVLISCIISLRTKDEVTAKASKRLFEAAPTAEKMMNLPVLKIEKLIFPCGFYKTKARRIKEIARKVHEIYKNKVPETMDELLAFKGVGRKTANIVMVYGHRKEGMPIDTHCHRIPNRLGWINTKTPKKTEEALRQILPKRYWQDFNDLFVSFGQNICRPVSPHCWECPVTKYCKYYREVYLENVQRRKIQKL